VINKRVFIDHHKKGEFNSVYLLQLINRVKEVFKERLKVKIVSNKRERHELSYLKKLL